MGDEEIKENEYKSTKSHSTFVCRGKKKRAFLIVTGEAASFAKVTAAVEKVRIGGGNFAEVDWLARQLSNTY